MIENLKDQVVVITGAGSGLGRAFAEIYAQHGAKVVASDIDKKNCEQVVKAIQNQEGTAVSIVSNSANPKESEALVAETIRQFGRLDIAINNAGIGGPISPTGTYPIGGWQKVIDINLSGVFYGMRYQIPAMVDSGGGHIINIASILGAVGTQGSPAYVAAKHGVVGLTKAAALEYAQSNIRINAVGPAYIKTPLLESLDQETKEALVRLHPMGRLGNVNEVAEFVLWLGSSKSSFMTGAYYPVDGGYLAQ